MKNFTESETYINDNLNEYKGIFYNENNEEEQKFYEGGAHFKYYELFDILEELVLRQENDNKTIQNEYNNPKNTILNFNFISKGKSRNIKEITNNKKEERKENESELNKNKDNCTMVSYNQNKLKKIFGIPSHTILDKKLKILLKINLPNKKFKKKKNSPIKYKDNIRPVSSKINNMKNNKKRKEILILGKNFQNTSYPKGRNIIENKNKLNSIKKLSCSSQNLRKIFYPLNRFKVLSRNQPNKSPNNDNSNKHIKNIIPYKTSISKVNTVISYKSRNMNIINEYNNFLFQNNKNGKISRTFHNISNSKNKTEINYYQVKEKTDSLSKIKSEDNKINNNDLKSKNNEKILSNLVSKTNQKLFNYKISHINLINNLFRNNKEKVNNTNSLEISIKSNFSSTHNLNIQIPSRNKKYKATNVNKTSNNPNNFLINSNFNNLLKTQKNNFTQNKKYVNNGLINNKVKINEKISNSISKVKTKSSSVNSTGSKTNSIIGKGKVIK